MVQFDINKLRLKTALKRPLKELRKFSSLIASGLYHQSIYPSLHHILILFLEMKN